MKLKYDVAVVGGAGHVGIPLSLVLADRGLRTLIYDINPAALRELQAGRLPFIEEGGEALLRKVLKQGRLGFSQSPADLRGIPMVVVTIGTPIDEFHNPDFSLLTRAVEALLPHLSSRQTIILRSTVAPGVTDFLERYLRRRGSKVGLAFCPERVVQGKGIAEIQSIPQFVTATSARARSAAQKLFAKISPLVIEMEPVEAEFAKLICNTFRYITFAATNQLYMMCASAGIDYLALLEKVHAGYPRMAYIPGPGFAAGPCLMKDTMQLFAFGRHNFPLGQMAMTINEGLPNFIVERLGGAKSLKGRKVGILGMAFKAESDDIRDSLSYKLGKILRFQGAEVLYSDEYMKDRTFISRQKLCREAEIIIVGVPHRAYAKLKIPPAREVIDLWASSREPVGRSAVKNIRRCLHMNKDEATQLIGQAIGQFNQIHRTDRPVPATPETRLFGQGGQLDSLDLVRLVFLVEESVEQQTGRAVALTSERAMSQRSSPFATVGSLADYVVTLLAPPP